ncbi:hypothetical protein LOY34_13910 [Pseudomonas sp. B21-009]|uniref:hypothetical protein n=1 Tax=Pseudomonas sp. B21-009 TaxID=2895470 RepID=UPI00215FF8E6|nr:hypothetical protein [Pseudomonas sp. B21-009]UVM64447.1 hypothetical protein LOY34_13910 [Pseudomonas sp. B21-009]
MVGAWKAGDQDLHLRTDALDGFLGEHTVEEVALGLLAEVERLEGCEEVLRNLASYVGTDAYSASEVAPEVFARKIMDGINILNDPLAQLAEKRGAERDQLAADNESLRGSCKAMGLDMGKLTRERNSFRRSAEKLKAENEALRSTCARASACMDRWASGHPFDGDGPGGRIRDELYDAFRPGARDGIAKLHALMGGEGGHD